MLRRPEQKTENRIPGFDTSIAPEYSVMHTMLLDKALVSHLKENTQLKDGSATCRSAYRPCLSQPLPRTRALK